jgi:uncharacterized membrane protein YbhN (UPF0104 family)
MKQGLRWVILGGTLFFLGKTLQNNWSQVNSLSIDAVGWTILAVALGITLLAHIWAAWVWTWVLRDLNQSFNPSKFIQVYLKTNIAKYIPGNIWHFYGRIIAAKNEHISPDIATLSVLLEPLLMAAAALILIVLCGNIFLTNQMNIFVRCLQFVSLGFLFYIVHPKCLNLLLRVSYKLKTKKPHAQSLVTTYLNIKRYPLFPMLGELVFLGLRGLGFICTIFAFTPVSWEQVPLIFGAFSLAWLLGLIVPFAPGGLGIFEATAIALLQYHFPSALIISAIALYRLISILAEIAGAVLAWLDEKLIVM